MKNWSPIPVSPASPCCSWRESGGTTSENLVFRQHTPWILFFSCSCFSGILLGYSKIIWIILDLGMSQKVRNSSIHHHPSKWVCTIDMAFFQFRDGNPWMEERHRGPFQSAENHGSQDDPLSSSIHIHQATSYSNEKTVIFATTYNEHC